MGKEICPNLDGNSYRESTRGQVWGDHSPKEGSKSLWWDNQENSKLASGCREVLSHSPCVAKAELPHYKKNLEFPSTWAKARTAVPKCLVLVFTDEVFSVEIWGAACDFIIILLPKSKWPSLLQQRVVFFLFFLVFYFLNFQRQTLILKWSLYNMSFEGPLRAAFPRSPQVASDPSSVLSAGCPHLSPRWWQLALVHQKVQRMWCAVWTALALGEVLEWVGL